MLWEPRAVVSEHGGPTGTGFLHVQLGHRSLPPQYWDLQGQELALPTCSLHPSPRPADQAGIGQRNVSSCTDYLASLKLLHGASTG